jgi:hypothetical protein
METIYLITGFLVFWGVVCGTIAGTMAIAIVYIKEYLKTRNEKRA